MTKIEWTNATWNPVIGCSKVSSGCQNCYAEKMAGRLSNIAATSYYIKVVKSEMQKDNPNFIEKGLPIWNGKTHLVKSALTKPFHWKKPRMIFVCSMGDLFHESLAFADIFKVYEVIAQCRQHIFQVLTKRPERMMKFFEWLGNEIKRVGLDSIPSESKNSLHYLKALPNLWLGVSAENQEQADKRIPILLKIPAAIRFVSCEPLLGPVQLFSVNHAYIWVNEIKTSDCIGLDWVIAGGESGPNARPMHPAWAISLRDQCKVTGTPFFFKQWGAYRPAYYKSKSGNALIKLNPDKPEIILHNPKVNMIKTRKKVEPALNGKLYKQFPVKK